VTVEPAAGFGEFGALPPKLDRETVRGTVSKNPRYDVAVPSAQWLMGIETNDSRRKSCHLDEQRQGLDAPAVVNALRTI